ncbi:hypothetical protein WICMUC_005008 [Wickerhamomyces mucosus]|uniref:Peroxin-19 n=1 Tax=Wickerhamomyces mucosus TaxID=1378264 RepID=A0A9P8T855_9ASCO|nr:hypothetical protein WICMUC_005008 [Wickerhamomyces mucosus]
MSQNKYYEDEDDLDDLDDYLDEFQDEILNKPYNEIEAEANSNVNDFNDDISSNSINENQLDNNQTDDQIQDQLKDVLNELSKESPEARQQFEHLLKEVNNIHEREQNSQLHNTNNDNNLDNNTPSNFQNTISDTLNRLKNSGAKVDESIKDEQSPDQLLLDLLTQLNLSETNEGKNDVNNNDNNDNNENNDNNNKGNDDLDLGNLLTDMLDQLVSKSILYDPLKDLSLKYPTWLTDNKDKISNDEFIKYELQYSIISDIVSKFEEDSYKDNSISHKQYISIKLEEMEAAGEPPKELAGDLSKTGIPGFQFNSSDTKDIFPKDLEKGLEENCNPQ